MLTLIMSLWKPSVVNRGNPPKKGKKRLNEENLDQTQTDIRPPPIGNQFGSSVWEAARIGCLEAAVVVERGFSVIFP